MKVEYKILTESEYVKCNEYMLDELGLLGWIICSVVQDKDSRTFYFYRVINESN